MLGFLASTQPTGDLQEIALFEIAFKLNNKNKETRRKNLANQELFLTIIKTIIKPIFIVFCQAILCEIYQLNKFKSIN